LIIQDISASCRISMNVAVPVVSCLDNWVSILPTALLSTHTGNEFEGYTFLDLTQEMEGILQHWQSLGIKFDGILIGYLGSHQQIDIVRGIIHTFAAEDAHIVLDPAMGDQGVLYPGFTLEYVEEMAALCKEATVITPNVTEACFLTQRPMLKKPYKETEVAGLLAALRVLNPKSIVLTGVSLDPETIGAVCISHSEPEAHYAFAKHFPGHYDGAGDLFTSVVGGLLFQDLQLTLATDTAVRYNSMVIERTLKSGRELHYGVQFETDLPYLIEQLRKYKPTE
jgi:pyridoxine kinase